MFLVTSDDIQSLFAQGRTITETLEIARDVAKKLLELQEQRLLKFRCFLITMDYPFLNITGDMPERTLRSILKQAGIDTDVFLNLSERQDKNEIIPFS